MYWLEKIFSMIGKFSVHHGFFALDEYQTYNSALTIRSLLTRLTSPSNERKSLNLQILMYL